MPQTRSGRRGAALGLLVLGGTLALLGCQQLAPTASEATDDEQPLVMHTEMAMMAPLPAPVDHTGVPLGMAAARPTGEFEALVKPTPLPTQIPTQVPTVAPTPEPTAAPAPPVYESGIASTYGEGDGFEGNRTACGQIFHTSVPQVAHKSLPCGTKVRVEDTDTGRTVEAEVTDRGPYVRGRIVDLSWGAFRELEPNGPGLLHVNVYVLDTD
jgi:rare lipoprotein A